MRPLSQGFEHGAIALRQGRHFGCRRAAVCAPSPRAHARCSLCRRCQRIATRSIAEPARSPDCRCTLAWRPGRMNARSLGGSGGSSAGRPSRKSACRSRSTGMSVASLRRRTETAPRTLSVVRPDWLIPRKPSLGCAVSGAAPALAGRLCQKVSTTTPLGRQTVFRCHSVIQNVDPATSPTGTHQDYRRANRRFTLPIRGTRGPPSKVQWCGARQ